MHSEISKILGEKREFDDKWLQAERWTFNPFVGNDRQLPDGRMFANYTNELRQVVTCVDDKLDCFLVGAFGTGKSTFIQHLLQGLPSTEFRTAFVEKPSGSPKDFFMKILTDFHSDFKKDDTVGGLFAGVIQSIRNFRNENINSVIAIDEIADAPTEILRWIRVLCDERPSMIFSGFPETPSIIAEKFYPLYDRVFKTVELKGLDLVGVIEFVARRIRVARQETNWNRSFNEDISPFEPEAIDVLRDSTGGAPRYVWRACYDAIRWCIDNDRHTIDSVSLSNILRNKIESTFATISRKQRDMTEILLKRHNMSSSEIAESLQLSTAAVDGLLKPLEEAEIVRKVGKRKGYEYTLTPMAERYFAREERA